MSRGRAARISRALAWPAAAAFLFACYLRVSWTQPVNSDGAANALQAWDMLHGNLLLHGWSLSDVSFYTTELPQYALLELGLGLGPGVVHVAAAMTYTLVVLLTALLGAGPGGRPPGPAPAGRADGAAPRRLGRAVIAAGIMLAPQPGNGAYVLLLSPDHLGSTVPVLAAFVLLDRVSPGGDPPEPPRLLASWRQPPGTPCAFAGSAGTRLRRAPPRQRIAPVALAAVLLTLGLVADPVVAYTGVVPLLVACAVRSYQGAIMRQQPWASQRYPLVVGAAAVGSAGGAALISHGLRALGGYQVSPVHPWFATTAALSRHLPTAAEGTAVLFGADFSGQPAALAAGLALVHLAGLAAAGYAVWLGLRRYGRLPDLVTLTLVTAVLLNLAGFVLSTRVTDARSAREMVAVLPFGAALAGRLLGENLTAPRLRPVVAAVLACYLVSLGYAMAQPAVPAAGQRLADWLAARRLGSGLAPYWQADVITLASHGAAAVRPVCVTGRQVTAEHWESRADWYRPRRGRATFLIVGGSAACNHVTAAQARSAFGRPAHSYRVDGYTVLVWPRNLLTVVR